MKKYLLGAAALLAISAPGVAAAQTGHVDLSYQNTEADIGGLDGEGEGWNLGGSTAWGCDGTVGVQLDGSLSNADDVSAWGVGGHLFSRNTNHLIGGFATYGNTDIDGGDDVDAWAVGLEGQYYFARTTLDGALTYSEADDLDAELTAVDAGLTHFFTDNFSLGGNLGFGNIEGLGGDADVSTFGVTSEYQFASAPISIFGGWQHTEIDDFDADADTLSIGVRYNWGGTLLDRNRSGASLARGGGLGRYAGLL
jgi:hypothetical protein